MTFYKLFPCQAVQLYIQLHWIPLAVDHQIRRRWVREDLQVVYGILRGRYRPYEERRRDVLTSPVVPYLHLVLPTDRRLIGLRSSACYWIAVEEPLVARVRLVRA